MAKYDPLRKFLRRQPLDELVLSFDQIERAVGDILPKSAGSPQWWANEVAPNSRHVQCRSWLDAGYEAFLLEARKQVRFVRARHRATNTTIRLKR